MSIATKGSRRSTDLAQARGEDDDLVNFTHPFQEVVYAWTLDDVHVVPVIFDLHWHDVIRVLDGLEKDCDDTRR